LPPGVEIEELPASAGQVERAVAPLPEVHRFGIAARIAAGDVCWVARVAGEVIYQMWVSIGSTYSYTLDRHFPLAPTDTVEFGAYTVPAYRGQSIHSAVVSQVLVRLRERGMKRIIALMEADNQIALRMPRKLGLATVGFAAFIEIAGVRFHFMRDRGALPLVRPRHYWVRV
jgi:RimJ/RimL family protein N-acetyltransferase